VISASFTYDGGHLCADPRELGAGPDTCQPVREPGDTASSAAAASCAFQLLHYVILALPPEARSQLPPLPRVPPFLQLASQCNERRGDVRLHKCAAGTST
jgi:hypothetical protein